MARRVLKVDSIQAKLIPAKKLEDINRSFGGQLDILHKDGEIILSAPTAPYHTGLRSKLKTMGIKAEEQVVTA